MASWDGEPKGGVVDTTICLAIGAVFTLMFMFGCTGDAEGGTIPLPLPTPIYGVIVPTATPTMAKVPVRVYLPIVMGDE